MEKRGVIEGRWCTVEQKNKHIEVHLSENHFKLNKNNEEN